MNFIKKNKFTIIAIIIFTSLVIVGVKVKELLVPDSGKAVYGDRLEGIDGHKLSDSLFVSIKEKLKENENVLNVSNKVHGKIINLIITVNNELSVLDAKQLANNTISFFVDDELSYYSLQVYVIKEDGSLNNFPIIGYKDTESKELIFTKDREITVSEENQDEKE